MIAGIPGREVLLATLPLGGERHAVGHSAHEAGCSEACISYPVIAIAMKTATMATNWMVPGSIAPRWTAAPPGRNSRTGR